MIAATQAACAAGECRGELLDLSQCHDLAEAWTRLQVQADGSPFDSWAWVSTWLRHLPQEVVPRVFRATDAAGVAALALVVEHDERWPARLFGPRCLLLQETGRVELDEVSIEYGGLLARRGAEDAAYRALFDTLQRHWAGWRRVRITATRDAARIAANLPDALRGYAVHAAPAYHVDLAALRAKGSAYLPALGRNARHKLGQSRRAFEAHGPLQVELAPDPASALEWLEALRLLHERRWRERGKPGAFASGFFHAFHRDLVQRWQPDGFAQLARVRAGDVAFAYLYNFQWNDTVYFYNCGLHYGTVPRYDSPGMLGLATYLQHALDAGRHAFDFLAGAQDYKRRLATGHRMLQWIDIRRTGPAHGSERMLARLMRKPTFGRPLATGAAA